ncbi:MAG: hypothetical protein LBI04_02085 [Treponema sp.]|nr:hypothetical protein [Treponema sp.]
MKKLAAKVSFVLLSAMLIFSFAACSDDDPAPTTGGAASLNSLKAAADGGNYNAVLGSAISTKVWSDCFDKGDIPSSNVGRLNFGGLLSNEVIFTATASSGATVTYAVVDGYDLPLSTDFKPITDPTRPLKTNDTVYFKVVSGSATNYYCIEIENMGETQSNSVRILALKIGSVAEGINPDINDGSAAIGTLVPISYVMPSVNINGDVTLELTMNNAGQTISWAKKAAADAAPADADFTAFGSPTDGVLSVQVSNNGLKNGDKVYVKVIATDGASTRYYGFVINTGNIAELASLHIEGEEAVDLGTPGATWNDTALVAVPFDYQVDPAPAEFTITAVALDNGTVDYGVVTSGAPTFAPLITKVPLVGGSILYLKVTSASGNSSVVYRLNILMKNNATVYYGQPTIHLGTGGAAPELDSLWAGDDWNFSINRVNRPEMTPVFKFLNTVDGTYDQNGYGHTVGKAKAFWDDYGMYVYAQMDFHDYYANAAAKTAGTISERKTTLSPVGASAIDNSSAHEYDSLEIFTNERRQQYKEGSYGIQYRIAPSPANSLVTNSRVSGTVPSGADRALNIFYDSEKYYSWVIKDGTGKEVGYSVIAYIPWMFKNDSNANQVFGTGGLVTASATDGPTIGVEFQLNTSTSAPGRDAILTWNGVNGKAYSDGVKNYGNVKLVGGSNFASRGTKDPAKSTVQFVPGNGTAIEPKMVNFLMPLGADFPADPVRSGFLFNGWWDEDASPKVRYDANTVITASVKLTAAWINEADIRFRLDNWITANGSTFDSEANSVKAGAGNTTPTQPFYMNGTVPTSNFAYADNGDLLVMIGSSGQGLRISTVAPGVDPETGNPTGGLGLDFTAKHYEIFIGGSIDRDGNSASTPELRIQLYASGETTIFTQNVTHVVGDTFSFGGEIKVPETVTPAEIVAVRFTSGSGGANMVFRLTNLMIIEKN